MKQKTATWLEKNKNILVFNLKFDDQNLSLCLAAYEVWNGATEEMTAKPVRSRFCLFVFHSKCGEGPM